MFSAKSPGNSTLAPSMAESQPWLAVFVFSLFCLRAALADEHGLSSGLAAVRYPPLNSRRFEGEQSNILKRQSTCSVPCQSVCCYSFQGCFTTTFGVPSCCSPGDYCLDWVDVSSVTFINSLVTRNHLHAWLHSGY